MARWSARSMMVAVVAVVVIVFLFRGAGHWLVGMIGTIHGHGAGH